MFGVFFPFSIRYLIQRKGRTVATLFGIALGIVMIVATGVVNRSTLASFQQMVTMAAGKAQLQAMPGAGSGFKKEYLSKISRIDGVKAAYPVVVGASPVVKGGSDRDVLMMYGVDASRDREVREYDLEKGRFLNSSGREVLLTADWAGKENIRVGDRTTLLTSGGLKEFEVVGLLAGKGVGSTNAGKFAVTNIQAAQEMFSREGLYDQADIVLTEGTSADTVKEALERSLGGNLVIERPASRGKDVDDSMSSYQFMLRLTGSIALCIGLFIIYNNVEISVEERRFSIAMLRALGMRRKKILALLLAESALLGLVGGAVGVLFGLGLAKGMAAALANLTSALNRVTLTDLGITPGILAMGLAAGPIASVIASLIPAFRMLRIEPLEALSQGEKPQRGGNLLPIILGALLLALGLGSLGYLINATNSGSARITAGVFENIGVVGLVCLMIGAVFLLPVFLRRFLGLLKPKSIAMRLAVDNLSRASGRSAASIAGMMVALTAFVAFSAQSLSYRTFTNDWINRAIGWDMLVSSSFFGTQMDVPLDKAFGEKLRRVPGVKIACALRFTRADFKGTKVGLNNFDMSHFFDFVEMSVIEGEADSFKERLRSGKYVVISSITARRFNLHAGDTMEFKTARGPVNFPIAAVVKEMGSDTGTVYLDIGVYQRLWGDYRIDGYDVVLNKGFKVSDVKRQIERELGKNRHLTITEHEQFRKNIMALVDQSFAMTDLLVYIAIVVAVLGVMNTALISVWQRKKEIATLRALGARARLIKRLLTYESLIMGLLGALIGISAGTIVGRAMVSAGRGVSGIFLEYQTPVAAMITALALGVGLSALGSIIPGRAGARTEIVDGIRYE